MRHFSLVSDLSDREHEGAPPNGVKYGSSHALLAAGRHTEQLTHPLVLSMHCPYTASLLTFIRLLFVELVIIQQQHVPNVTKTNTVQDLTRGKYLLVTF